jgi:hypothetical protein
VLKGHVIVEACTRHKGKEKTMTLKQAKAPNAFGEDIYTIATLANHDFAAIITVTQGRQTRLEIYPYQFKSSAQQFLDKELDRYDILELGASGRVVELVEVNA